MTEPNDKKMDFRERARNIYDLIKECEYASTSIDHIAQALLESRNEALEEAERAVEAEPELPGDMPDEMWAAIRNDRDACQESHKITVRGTKKNIIHNIRQLKGR